MTAPTLPGIDAPAEVLCPDCAGSGQVGGADCVYCGGIATGPISGHVQQALALKRRITSDQIIAAYKDTGSVWRAGKQLGIAGQTVHSKLRALQYPLAKRSWTTDEVDELRRLVGEDVRLGEIANRLGRPYAGVACKASELGARSNQTGRNKKLPRGGGWDKASTLRHITALDIYDGPITRYARANGLSLELLVQAVQKHQPDWWTAYVATHSDLEQRTCHYCETLFIPANARQRSCTRQCASVARVDASYFGGKRRETIGLAASICQLCGRHVTKGLSSHHVYGKENDHDNTTLVALCRGCHNIVTMLAGRTFVGDETSWESLITLTWARKHGAEVMAGSCPNTLHVTVDIDLYEGDEP